jgi:hypothetical protein
MTYSKPELVLMADARVAIQSGNDGIGKDGLPPETMNQSTQAAYEADE